MAAATPLVDDQTAPGSVADGAAVKRGRCGLAAQSEHVYSFGLRQPASAGRRPLGGSLRGD